ncbi:MAG: hypothetical protein ABI253_02020 [Mycobacterium sp.]
MAACSPVATCSTGAARGLRTIGAKTALATRTAIAPGSTGTGGGLRIIGTETTLTTGAAIMALCPGHLFSGERPLRRRRVDVRAVVLQPLAGVAVDTGFIEHLLGGVNYRVECRRRGAGGISVRFGDHRVHFRQFGFHGSLLFKDPIDLVITVVRDCLEAITQMIHRAGDAGISLAFRPALMSNIEQALLPEPKTSQHIVCGVAAIMVAQ